MQCNESRIKIAMLYNLTNLNNNGTIMQCSKNAIQLYNEIQCNNVSL